MWCRFVVGILLRNGYRLHVTCSSSVDGFFNQKRQPPMCNVVGVGVNPTSLSSLGDPNTPQEDKNKWYIRLLHTSINKSSICVNVSSSSLPWHRYLTEPTQATRGDWESECAYVSGTWKSPQVFPESHNSNYPFRNMEMVFSASWRIKVQIRSGYL